MGFTHTLIYQIMKVIGLMIRRMEQVLKFGKMDRIVVIIYKEKKKEQASTNGRMVPNTKENGMKTTFTAMYVTYYLFTYFKFLRVYTHLLILKYILANIGLTKCMAMENYIISKRVKYTQVIHLYKVFRVFCTRSKRRVWYILLGKVTKSLFRFLEKWKTTRRWEVY